MKKSMEVGERVWQKLEHEVCSQISEKLNGALAEEAAPQVLLEVRQDVRIPVHAVVNEGVATELETTLGVYRHIWTGL